jgi:hypothetical protein
MAISTFECFAGAALEMIGLMKPADRSDMMRDLMVAYRAYLSGCASEEESRGSSCGVSGVTAARPATRVPTGSVYVDPVLVPGHTRVPTPTWSDVSRDSPVVVAREAGLNIACPTPVAMAPPKRDVQFDITSIDGLCYLSLMAEEMVATVEAKLGQYPMFKDVLKVPTSYLDPAWRDKKVTRTPAGIYHVADQGVIPVERCLVSVVRKAGDWPEGSFGASLVGCNGGVKKAPDLVDRLGGLSTDSFIQCCAKNSTSSLGCKLDDMVMNTPGVVVLDMGLDMRYSSAGHIPLMVAFDRGRPKGFIPLLRVEQEHVKDVSLQVLTSAPKVQLVCFDAGSADFGMVGMQTLVTYTLRIRDMFDLASRGRTRRETAEQLVVLTQRHMAELQCKCDAMRRALHEYLK